MSKDLFFSLDTYIRTKFGLFQNQQRVREDEKAYNEINALCLEEVFHFLEENLDVSRRAWLIADLNRLEGRGVNADKIEFIDTLLKYLSIIPHYRLRLDARLRAFLNNLHYQTITYGNK